MTHHAVESVLSDWDSMELRFELADDADPQLSGGECIALRELHSVSPTDRGAFYARRAKLPVSRRVTKFNMMRESRSRSSRTRSLAHSPGGGPRIARDARPLSGRRRQGRTRRCRVRCSGTARGYGGPGRGGGRPPGRPGRCARRAGRPDGSAGPRVRSRGRTHPLPEAPWRSAWGTRAPRSCSRPTGTSCRTPRTALDAPWTMPGVPP